MQSYNSGTRFISAVYEGSLSAGDMTNGISMWRIKLGRQAFSCILSDEVVILGRIDGTVKVLRLADG